MSMSQFLNDACQQFGEARKIEAENEVARTWRPTSGLPSPQPHYDRAAALALVSIATALERILDGAPLRTMAWNP